MPSDPEPRDVPPPLLPDLDYDPANQSGSSYIPPGWQPMGPPPSASVPQSGPPVDISNPTMVDSDAPVTQPR